MIIDVNRFLILKNHPQYGIVVYEVTANNLPCPYCGGNDLHKLEVVTDNNFGADNGYVYPYDARVGKSILDCGVKLEKQLKGGDLVLQTPEKDAWRRELIIKNNL